MDERSGMDKLDEVMLPGFRFHPTDEELVAFYLRRKVNQKPLSIELIRQLDIYKYDPWELPKLAATGEKEWYFFCPRDRKYRNSSRPNRVTGAGFWKATGTDRPIYSSEGTKCIGLKKSLVFYKGRAAKGIKTDWMMHEFRLPSLNDPSLTKGPIEKNIPANDAWAICRIFKKTNTMAQRALSHSWVSAFPVTMDSNMISVSNTIHSTHFGSENISCTTEGGSSVQFGCNNVFPQHPSSTSYPPLDINSYKPINLTNCKLPPVNVSRSEIPAGFMFSHVDMTVPSKCTVDVASMEQILSSPTVLDVQKASASIGFSQQQQCNSFSADLPTGMNGTLGIGGEEMCMRRNTNASQASNNHQGTVRPLNFPFSLASNVSDAWRPNLTCYSPPCPSEMSASYSTNKCNT